VEVRVHGSHMTVGNDLRALAEEKVAHAARVFDDAAFADVEFSAEKNPRISGGRYRVEITSAAAGRVIRVEAAEFDHRAALEVAVGKFERQLRRLKERLISRHRRGRGKQFSAKANDAEETEAATELRIERRKQFVVKPMTPEEAALQMELLEHSFYLFLNAETDVYSVIYRRRGGSLGMIEPL
jgi:putative sigma-54 modulation protein